MNKKPSIFYRFIKRLFDIISSLLFIIVFSWFYLLIMIINAIATKGSPLYIDKRVGKNYKVLRLLKFRSMYVDADTKPEKYLNKEQLERWKTERKVPNDPRITKFGKFLRKTSIDELPQLFNVLVGQMSIVGPRPINKEEMDINYSSEEADIYVSAKPGLISNWGVNGRNNVSYKDNLRQNLELDYFKKRSLFYDLCLIFKAIKAVVSRKGAE